MNVDVESGHDDMKRGYQFVCGECGHKTHVVMEPGLDVTIPCPACKHVLYSKGGSRVFAGDKRLCDVDSLPKPDLVFDEDPIMTSEKPKSSGRRKNKLPAVTEPHPLDRAVLSDEENEAARKMLDWLS